MLLTPPSFLREIDGSEYLRLPKSTLQTQFAHGAKSDIESDFNFETEYLIACSIPEKPPGETILLQECLADYFTNIVQVRRQLVTPAEEKASSNAWPAPPAPVNYSTKPTLYPSPSYSSSSGGAYASSSADDALPPYTGNGNGFYGDEKALMKKSYQTQERNVAAWQFFKLLPYYAPTSMDSEIAAHLANEKPILGICLKRYGYDTVRKQPYRNGRPYSPSPFVPIPAFLCLSDPVISDVRIVIPKYIELSNFVTQEEEKLGGPPKRYQLVFYSAVCHRGRYVQSGHYISIIWDRQNEQYDSPLSVSNSLFNQIDGSISMILQLRRSPHQVPNTSSPTKLRIPLIRRQLTVGT